MSALSDGNTVLGAFLLKSRMKFGWSLCELEKKTGITPSYLNRLEKGARKNPTVSIVHALAKAYGIEVTTLVDLVLLEQKGEKNDD